ncbi:hypothetical protein ACFL0E_00065 [Nanoarchaeota archaeon]
MEEKFSYYDFLANIIPGSFMVWALNNITDDLFFGNIVMESLMFIILAYILGLVIQHFSKYVVEIIVKIIFWKGTFFSNIFLIRDAKKCSEHDRKKFLNFIITHFNFSKKEIKVLDTNNIYKKINRDKLKKAEQISHSIYKAVDTYTYDHNIAKKAHLHQNYYGLFRGLSLSFLFIGLFFTLLISQLDRFQTLSFVSYQIISYMFFIIFLVKTKDRGEKYIRGLFETIKYKKNRVEK